MPAPIYFDYNATTPLDPAVQAVMLPFFEKSWGNPSSVHQIGRQARALLDDARDRAALVLGAKPSEIVFTSGGTEANNLAIFGAARLLKPKGRHLITTSVEHHAVLECFNYLEKHENFSVTRLPVDHDGRIDVSQFAAAIRPDTVLVSVMAANNEIGTLQPVSEVGAICRQCNIIFHTDAVQWFGKKPFDRIAQFNADLVSVCGHKFHGPKGAGLLFIKSPLHPHPLIFGGAHENERRAGTENLPAIAGFVSALEKFTRVPVFDDLHLKSLITKLLVTLKTISACHIVSPSKSVLNNTVAFTVQGSDAITLLANLDLEGVCASSGSACTAGSIEPSHVVAAIGRPSEAHSLIRFSLGRDTTTQEVDFVCSILPKIITRSQRG